MNSEQREEFFKGAFAEMPQEVQKNLKMEKKALELATKGIAQLESLTIESWKGMSKEEQAETDPLTHASDQLSKALDHDNNEDIFVYMKAVVIAYRMLEARLELFKRDSTKRFGNNDKKMKMALSHEILFNSGMALVMRRIKQDILENYELPQTPPKKSKK